MLKAIKTKTAEKRDYVKYCLVLVVLSGLLFLLGNNIVGLTNDNEVFYAQTAKEMIRHQSWMTPYLFDQPQFEKPIFIYWLIRIGFILFGVTSFGARFFPAVFAVLAVIGVYCLCALGFKDPKKAFLSSVILMTAGMFVGMAKTLFTDMVFTAFILFSLLAFYWGYTARSKKTAGLLLFSFFSGLAVLTKGPLGVLLIVPVAIVFLLIKKNLKFLICPASFWGAGIFLSVVLPWYMIMLKEHGSSFIQEFFYNDNIRRLLEAQYQKQDTWYFYPSLLVGSMFPWSLFVLAGFVYLPKFLKQKENNLYLFLLCWLGVTSVILQVAHSKIANYILPIFPVAAILAGSFISDALVSGYRRLISFLLSATLLVIFALPLYFITTYSKYFAQLTDKRVLLFMVAAFFVFVVTMVYFLIKNKPRNAAFSLALVMPIILCALPLVQHNFGSSASSEEASNYLLAGYKPENTILCSKSLVRGVRYFTDKDVAIVDIGGRPLFSRHPIPTFDTKEKLLDFLRGQGTTYAVLKKSTFNDIKSMAGNEFRVTLLRVLGVHYITKIEEQGVYVK